MKKCIESENEKLHHRMKRIIGQVQAVDRMIEEEIKEYEKELEKFKQGKRSFVLDPTNYLIENVSPKSIP